MLDKKTEIALLMLSEKVGYGYKVVRIQDLLDSLPKKYRFDAENFARIISFLKENDYIVVKYRDKDEICLTLTVKSENYLAEKRHNVQKSKITSGQIWLLFSGVFVAAFLGTMTAILILKLFV